MSDEPEGFEPRIRSKYNYYYRILVAWAFSYAVPFSYVHKHRSGLLDQSRQIKMHHFKEVAIRIPIGMCIGFSVSLFLFGSLKHDAPISKGLIIKGNTETKDDKSIDESNTSLDYSSDLVRNSRTRQWLPGKIRD